MWCDRVKLFKSVLLFMLLFLPCTQAFSNQECIPPSDEMVQLILLLDDSGSIDDDDFVIQQKGFYKAMLDLADAGLGDNILSVSVVYFSSKSKIAGENIKEGAQLEKALSEPHGGGKTNMTAAFADAIGIINRTPLEPDKNVHRLVILSTDGKPTGIDNPALAAAKALELKNIGNVTIAPIGVGDADKAFLDSISTSPPVPMPGNYLEFAREVTKLTLEQFSQVVGTPVVTDISVTDISVARKANGLVEMVCKGVVPRGLTYKYIFNVYDTRFDGLDTPSFSGESETGSYQFAPRYEGVYSASCSLLVYSNGSSCESKPKYTHIPVVSFDGGAAKDSDGDGLPDQWEIFGVRDDRGSVFLNLPEMGANPHCKDIFIEVDWIGNSRPSRKAFERIINAFAQAPVRNRSDRCKGVNLHIDAGEGRLLHYDAEQNKVAEQAYPPGGQEIPIDYEGWEEIYYGEKSKEAWLRLQSEYFTPARRGVFRYALIVPYIVPDEDEGKGEFSGIAYSIPSPGFMAMGEPSSIPMAILWKDKEIASTFMHELGHALGLGHGGAYQVGIPDNTNYKPNYLSIMNYHFQLTWLGKKRWFGFNGRYLDYSRWLTIDLDERNLNENDGIGIRAPSADPIALKRLLEGLSTRYSCNPKDDRKYEDASGAEWKYADVGDAINWNCKFSSMERGVKEDINYGKDDGKDERKWGVLSFLSGQKRTDWDNLDYAGRGVAGLGYAASSIGIITPFELRLRPYDPDQEEKVPDGQPMVYDVGITGERIYEVVPGGRYKLGFTVHNLGELEDHYNLSLVNVPVNVTASLSNSRLSLSARESAEETVSIEISKNSVPGEIYTLTIEAASENSEVVIDQHDIKIRVNQRVKASSSDSGSSGGGSLSWAFLGLPWLLGFLNLILNYRAFTHFRRRNRACIVALKLIADK